MPEFEFLNTKGSPKDWNDSRFEKLWLYNLHYFDYLNEGEVEGKGRQWKSDLILKWIQENPVGWGNGWEPYPISLRVVNWIKWLMREEGRGKREEVRKSLCEQVGWLYLRLEYHLLANHLLANAKALVFAGLYFSQSKTFKLSNLQTFKPSIAKRWYRKGMAIYRKELPEQICADGVHFERSAMYHSIILEDLLDCVKLLKRFESLKVLKFESSREDVDFFRGYAEKMLAGLKLLTGPDGKIAKFNDATEGIAKSPSELFTRAEAERIPLLHCRPRPFPSTSDSGFFRREAGEWTLLAKCGEIGPSYQPGHAHADTWSFELWKGARKLIGDTGCSTYVPGEVRSYERSTAAHNTVVIDGQNSSEVWASHRVGRRFDFRRHKRTFELMADGLKGCDELNGKGEHDVEIRFHLPPGVGKDEVTIECPGELTWEACLFAEEWNVRKPGLCAVFRSRQKFPVALSWSVR